MKQEKSCGAVIYKIENDKVYFLVIRQNQGHWCFPKGHVEGEESEYDTASREILEETGYEVSFVDGFRKTTNYSPKDDVMKEVVYFLAVPCGGEAKIQEDEVSEMRWATTVDVSALLTYENDASLFRKAVRFLKTMDADIEAML